MAHTDPASAPIAHQIVMRKLRDFVSYPFTAVRHDVVLPALCHGRDPTPHPVVVVGGGPVGLCAALALAHHGIPVLLLEADDAVCLESRAICISRRSLEIFQRLGTLDGFLKVGLPWIGGRSYYRDTEVLHFTMPADENQKLPPMVNVPQYDIEQILLERATEMSDLIQIRWQTRLTSIESHSDGVRLAVTTPKGDYRLDCNWLIAADGAHSFVRQGLGLRLDGTSYEGSYVIVDIRLDSARPTERLAYFDPPCNRGSTVLVHKQPGNVWRVDYQLRNGEDSAEAIRPANVIPRVESLLEMMGERGEWNPIWIGIYKASALTLPSYRHGRVLLAGDAAHLLPIFGVRGANSGIDDADNLAWKLAFVIKSLAAEALLDSYSLERVAAARENIGAATKSTEFMSPPSFAFELMRKAVLSLAIKNPTVRSLINPRQTTPITYAGSPLNWSTDARDFAVEPIPGAVLPECPLTLVESTGSRSGYMTDLLQIGRVPGFTALWFGEHPAVPASLLEVESSLRKGGLPFTVVPIVKLVSALPDSERTYGVDHTARAFPMYGAAPGTLLLIRPDGHVVGRWHRPYADLGVAVRRALGNPQRRQQHDRH